MSDEILPDKVRRGRVSRWLFTRTPQWALLMSELSDPGYRIYSLLLAHVNQADDDGEVWPQQQTLAEMLDRHRNSVSRVITKELVPLGLIDVEVERYGTNNTRRRNIYVVHELPPDDFEGWASLKEWYAAHPRPEPKPTNRRESKTAGQPGRTENSAVTRRRGNQKKAEASSPPPPPSADTPPTHSAGREDEIFTKEKKRSPETDESPGGHEDMERAQGLVRDAVRRWPKDHQAPSARDAHRLAERVAAELADGGDDTVILHELTRDLRDVGSAVRVMLGSRTRTPGWGRAADPRPDHSRYEIRTNTPWCGQCDERTRQLVVLSDDGRDERMARCRRCHPEATPAPATHEPDETPAAHLESLTPEEIRRIEDEQAARAAEARERREQQLAATRALVESVRSGAHREAATRRR